MSKASSPDDGPGIDRTITLTDAVVAIAMTLLILPLVDAVPELDGTDLAALWAENGELLQSFVISFLVVYAFWTAHGTLFRRLHRAGLEGVPHLGVINLFWLLVIAFVPFPTAMVGGEVNSTTAPIYTGTMLVLSALTFAMTVVVQRAVGGVVGLAWLTTAVFALCTVVSLFNAQLGLYLILLLFVTGRIEGAAVKRRQRLSVPAE